MEIRIDGWKSGLTFSSAHFLPDYSKCSHLHGHTYAVHVVIEGEMEGGILVDFRIIKRKLREIIGEIDHKVIIPTDGELNISCGEEIEVKHGNKKYIFPSEDCILLPIYSSSAENLAEYILKKFLNSINNEKIKRVELGVDEGYGQGAWVKWER